MERLDGVPAFFLAACLGVTLGLVILDLVMAAMLMVRALKGAS